MPDPRPRTRVATEQALVAAGRQLIVERPFETISTRDVAVAAGCNHGLITLYFGSKLGLFTRVLHVLIEELGVAVATGATIAELSNLPAMTTYWRLLASLLGAGLEPEAAMSSSAPVVEAIVQRSSAMTGLSLDDSRAFASTVILMMGGYHIFGEAFVRRMSPSGDAAGAGATLQQAAIYMLQGLIQSRQ